MEYTLTRPTFTCRKTGRQTPLKKWYIVFRDHLGARRRWPAYPDEKRSRALAERIGRLVTARQFHAPVEPDLVKWLDAVPAELRERLAAAGLIDSRLLARDEPLLDYLEGRPAADGKPALPGYRPHLLAQGDTADHAEQTVGRVRRILEGCALLTWRDLSAPETISAAQQFLGALRAKREISGTTLNAYCRCLRSFSTWLAGLFGTVSPMTGLRGVHDAAVDAQERRSFDEDELDLLANAAAIGPSRYDLEGWERALLYRFHYESGLRPGQVRQLLDTSFDLDDDPPTVTSKAATVKTRKPHVQALQRPMAAVLKTLFANKAPGTPAFRMPDKFTCAEMLRADLAAARTAWVTAPGLSEEDRLKRQRSDFLAPVDHQGRKADFYCLRHTHGTRAAESGASQKDVAASLNHSRTATTDRYMKSSLAAKARTVNALPEIRLGNGKDGQPLEWVAKGSIEANRSHGVTGLTTGEGPEEARMSGACQNPEQSSALLGMKKAPPASGGAFSSEGDGARTRNHRIDSPEGSCDFQGFSADSTPRMSGACHETPRNDLAGPDLIYARHLPPPPALDPDLQQLIAAWHQLPDHRRQMVMEIVRLARTQEEQSTGRR